jgi:hypothetical protein
VNWDGFGFLDFPPNWSKGQRIFFGGSRLRFTYAILKINQENFNSLFAKSFHCFSKHIAALFSSVAGHQDADAVPKDGQGGTYVDHRTANYHETHMDSKSYCFLSILLT